MIRDEPSNFVHSIPTPNGLAARLETLYGLDIESCRYLNGGVTDVYSVTDSGGRHFIARVARHGDRHENEVTFELDFLDYLAMRGANVCRAIRTLDDARTFSLSCAEGARSVMLTDAPSYIPVNCADIASMTAMAESVARMHTIAADYYAELSNNTPDVIPHGPHLGKQTLLRMPLEHMRAICSDQSSARKELQELSDLINAKLNCLGANNWSLSLCHGNLLPDNAHIDATGNITLSGFERCGIGWPVYDLATIRRHFEQTNTADCWPAFVQAYRRHNEPDAAQLEALPILVACRHLWSMGRRAHMARQMGRGYATENYLAQQIRFIREHLELFDATRQSA